MNHQLVIIIIATVFMSVLSGSWAFSYKVNWVQNPKESLNAWSSRMRFQIGDSLVFKTDNQSAFILVVRKEDYDSCSGSSPIDKVQSSKKLTRSGPYYFISSDAQKCMSGQKMMVVVLSPRGKMPVVATPLISPTPSMAPPAMPPSPSSMAPSMAPSSSMAPVMTPSSSMAPAMTPSSSMSPAMTPSSSMVPMPSAGGTMPGPVGSERPASAPGAMSAGSALSAAGVTIVIAIVGNVILA